MHARQALYCAVKTVSCNTCEGDEVVKDAGKELKKMPRLALDSLLQGEHVEEMMDTFNCFLDLTYPLSRPLSEVRICMSGGTVQRQMVQSAQYNTSQLRIVEASPHAAHNSALLHFAQQPI